MGNQNYNDVWLVGSANNSALTPPPADTQLWQFTGTHVTTYSGVHGTIQGPWNAAQFIDTLHGAASDPVVMDAPGLSNAGQDFTVWLRHW